MHYFTGGTVDGGYNLRTTGASVHGLISRGFDAFGAGQTQLTQNASQWLQLITFRYVCKFTNHH
jgi:hypothetical protein